MIVNITVKNLVTGVYTVIPVLPEELGLAGEETTVNTVTVLNLGAVDFPSGTSLAECSWTSFFPAAYDPSYCTTNKLKKPLEYIKIFKDMRDNKTPIQLIIPAIDVNKRMYVASFTAGIYGADGAFSYNIGLKELRVIRPVSVKLKLTAAGLKAVTTNKLTPASRPAIAATVAPKTYTTKSGDSLYLIAKSLNIPSWDTIFNLNRDKLSNPGILPAGITLRLP